MISFLEFCLDFNSGKIQFLFDFEFYIHFGANNEMWSIYPRNEMYSKIIKYNFYHTLSLYVIYYCMYTFSVILTLSQDQGKHSPLLLPIALSLSFLKHTNWRHFPVC